MKFISVRELRASTAQVWEDLDNNGEIVVMNNGQPQAFMVPVNRENLDRTAKAIRQAKAAQALDAMAQQARTSGLHDMSMEDIDAEIAATRSHRATA
jgi:antitoxin (DNA-binding transcriptional repressor) of toxin-antitoxin stability system